MAQHFDENIKKIKDLSSRTTELLFNLQRTYHNNVVKKVEELTEEKRKEMTEKLTDEKMTSTRRNSWIKEQVEQITSAIWKDVRSKLIIVSEEKNKELNSILSALEQKHVQDIEKLNAEANNYSSEKPSEQKQLITEQEKKYQQPLSSLNVVSMSCLACGNTNVLDLFVCSGCNRVLYCNETCQRRDWTKHQHSCVE